MAFHQKSEPARIAHILSAKLHNSRFCEKCRLRQKYLSIRDAIVKERRGEVESLLFQTLQKRLKKYATIASFLSFRSEIEMKWCNLWILEEKHLALPRIEKVPSFRFLSAFSELEKHPYGFFHPLDTCSVVEEIDCILVPALAFDRRGYRLGYGKGYYDMLIKQFPQAHTIGVGFTEQLVEELPCDDHDQKLDELLLF